MGNVRFKEPPVNIILAIYIAIMGISVTQLLSLLRGEFFRPIGDQIGVSIALILISSGSFVYYHSLIRYFRHDKISVRWTYITILGGCFLLLLSSFKLPFFYSLISAAILLIFLKFREILKSIDKYDENLFENNLKSMIAEKIKKTNQVVLGLFIILLISFGMIDFFLSDLSSNQEGIVQLFTNYFDYNNPVLNDLLTEVNESNYSSSVKESMKSKIFKLNNELISLNFNSRMTALLLVGFIIITFLYILIVRSRVKGLPTNHQTREALKIAFWKEETDDNNTSMKNSNEKIKLNFDNMSIFFISKKIFCLWPSLISGLISANITWQISTDIKDTFLVFLVVFCACAYGFSLNNIVDRYKDKYAKRKKFKLYNSPRALKIAKTQTLIFGLSSVIISLFLPLQTFYITLSVVGILSIYSWINNKYGILANLLTSLCVSLLVWVYPSSSLENFSNIVALSIFLFFYIFSREIVMDEYDYESDFKYKKSSIPIYIGKYNSLLLSLTLMTLNAIMLIVYIKFTNLNQTLLFPVIGTSLLSSITLIKYIVKKDDLNFNRYFEVTSLSYLFIFLAFIY